MDLYCIKLLNNLFINELLANKANIKEVGTLISENEIKFIINTKDENHKFIYEIAHNTFEVKYNHFYFLPNIKYNFRWKIEFIENDLTKKEIENFTYYYFIPETSKNRYLFKYISFGKGLNKLLTHNTFYFNKPQNFKDNTDCKYQIDTEPTQKNILDFYYKKELENNSNLSLDDFERTFQFPLKKQFNKDLLEHHYNGVFSLVGITCFSEKYDNKLMWDLYADGSKGVCLVFDTNVAGENYYSFTGKKVKYFNSPPKYFYDATKIMETAHIVFAKTKEYEFEAEVREFINFQSIDKIQRTIKFNPRALKAIIFGPNSLKSDKDEILNKFCSKSKYKEIEIIETTLDERLKLKVKNIL